MTPPLPQEHWLESHCRTLATGARQAAAVLAMHTSEPKDRWLRHTSQRLRANTASLLDANRADLEAAEGNHLSAAQMDRLRLTPERIADMAEAMDQVAVLPDPVGEVLEGHTRPNGLLIRKVRVPLGVVFFVYESRPNVTVDAAALCVKSGNAVILRGGKEAIHTNRALHRLMAESLHECGLPPLAVQLVDTSDREAVDHFVRMKELIDLVIPRGGKELIARVAERATVPVLKHYEGICHVYVDASADLDMALAIVLNAKCQRPGVCNAAECLLVHAGCADGFFAVALPALHAAGVELRVCSATREIAARVLKAHDAGIAAALKPATEQDYRTEYLDLILSVKVVASLAEAITHIGAYGSHHTDAIVTADLNAAQRFVAEVDSSAVMVNASPRFNDGGEFGLGAEVGISTDKLHARGPCGLRELTSYKYVVFGSGQVRG